MSLQTTINLNVDFYDKKYILINAKQYDKNSRFLEVTCYNHGVIFPVNTSEHSAYIRYKKSDNQSVFNSCEINRKGKILVELTEQMLASDGICFADLVIVNKGNASVDTDTGEIIIIDNASILSTMTFCIDVSETATENSEIESSYEYNGLNEALQKAEAEYSEVIQLSKSYAIGNANGIRENENIDNAKYYYEQSLRNANSTSTNASNASKSETNAKTSADIAKSYAVGGTGVRDGEDVDNAKYYAELALQNAFGEDSIVTGVKGSNETDYRKGNVNITVENIGAISSTDIATVDEIKNYLGI